MRFYNDNYAKGVRGYTFPKLRSPMLLACFNVKNH